MFVETINLRVGKPKNMNLNYSAADVAWNHNDGNFFFLSTIIYACIIRIKNRHIKDSFMFKQLTFYKDTRMYKNLEKLEFL